MERRERERRPRRVQVKFWPRETQKCYRGYSANISAGGMYIDTHHNLPPRGARVRLEVGEDGFMVEAVVARVNKSHQAMLPSGMGVRFLEIEELVGELIPEIGSTEKAPDMPPLPEGSYRLRFTDKDQFLQVYHRDLATGGLFIPTDDPAPLNEVITVELSVAGVDAAPVRFQARVVHRLDPHTPGGADNLIAGMGVELLAFEKTLKDMWTLVAQLEAPQN